VSESITRIVKKQLRKATRELLRANAGNRDGSIHKARKSLKKVRAALRLVRPMLGEDRYRQADDRLREASHALAPISNARATIDAFDALCTRYPGALERHNLASVRRALSTRKERVDQRARRTQSLEQLAEDLRAKRKSSGVLRFRTDGFRAVGPGVELSFRQARKAMRKALKHATPRHYHRWRRRVKNQWYHLRLLEGICGRAVRADIERLETLDACLGEYHNLVMLRRVILASCRASCSHAVRDELLQLVAREQEARRVLAWTLALPVYRETPRRFRARMKDLWAGAHTSHTSPWAGRQAA
jgi:CHAD domain-containing protein